MDEPYDKTNKYNKMYMDIAFTVAEMSFCKRKKVGAVMQRNGRIISMGWNGTRAGEDNTCEDSNGATLPEVAHAEENLLRKLITSHESSVGADVFVTAAPCIRCAEKLADARVSKVYYAEIYHGATFECGLPHLDMRGIEHELLEV